jgi:hypothetical protein
MSSHWEKRKRNNLFSLFTLLARRVIFSGLLFRPASPLRNTLWMDWQQYTKTHQDAPWGVVFSVSQLEIAVNRSPII